jgi:hypothetical protein
VVFIKQWYNLFFHQRMISVRFAESKEIRICDLGLASQI